MDQKGGGGSEAIRGASLPPPHTLPWCCPRPLTALSCCPEGAERDEGSSVLHQLCQEGEVPGRAKETPHVSTGEPGGAGWGWGASFERAGLMKLRFGCRGGQLPPMRRST